MTMTVTRPRIPVASAVGLFVLVCALLTFHPFPVQPGSSASAATSPTVTRLGGADRYAVSAGISRAAYPGGADIAYLSSGEGFPDALATGPAASKAGGPLLLTKPGGLPATILAELKRLAPSRLVVTGGPGSVNESVLTQLRSFIPSVTRIGGAERYEASRNIVRSAFSTSSTAFVVTGEIFSDALPASAAAAATGAPVVLVQGHLPAVGSQTRELLTSLGVTRVIIVGGPGTVSAGIEKELRSFVGTVDRAGGADRFDAAVALNSLVFPSASEAIVASGFVFGDALSGASLAAVRKAPLYTSRSDCLPDPVASDITGRLGATKVTLLGGPGSVGADVAGMKNCTQVSGEQKVKSERALVNKINAVLPGLQGNHNVTVREIGGLKRTVDVRGGNRVEPASAIKIFAAYATLKRIEAGQLYYSTRLASGLTVHECMTVMIHVSDNACHSDLIRVLGPNNMNALFAAGGYTGTHYAGMWKGTYYSYKTSSTNDLTAILQKLHNGTLLNAGNTKYLTDLLKSQIWRDRIPSGLPPGVVQASKPGELWVSAGMVQTDAAIVYAPRGTYVLAIMGQNGSNKAALARVSRVVYEHFNGAVSRTATFPVPEMYAASATTLRSSPGGSVIANIPRGTLVEVITSSRQWYQVKVNGRGGYAYAPHLGNRY